MKLKKVKKLEDGGFDGEDLYGKVRQNKILIKAKCVDSTVGLFYDLRFYTVMGTYYTHNYQ